MTALLDTGFLLAALAENDDLHELCALAMEEEPDVLLPEVVLPELAYLVLRDIDYATWIGFLRAVADGELPILATTSADLARAAQIMDRYADARIDFVDSVIVAFAERLNIQRILTVDRRHFRMIRPKHCSAFDIVP